MLLKLIAAGCLMALCVVVHAVGLTAALQWMRRSRTPATWAFWPSVLMLIVLVCWIILLHLVEITCWALLYLWTGAMPNLPTAFYFSTVTYTTTGYGDILLPEAWWLVGGIEALTGILLCGLSTGFLFAVVSRMYAEPQQTGPDDADAPLNPTRRP
jgi:hypothetical protein